jgi:hypothetical protein
LNGTDGKTSVLSKSGMSSKSFQVLLLEADPILLEADPILEKAIDETCSTGAIGKAFISHLCPSG